MDFEALKRLGLAYMNIDCEKSYESYNETNNNHIINIYLKKDENTCCPNCGSNNIISRGSIKRTLQFANTSHYIGIVNDLLVKTVITFFKKIIHSLNLKKELQFKRTLKFFKL